MQPFVVTQQSLIKGNVLKIKYGRRILDHVLECWISFNVCSLAQYKDLGFVLILKCGIFLMSTEVKRIVK